MGEKINTLNRRETDRRKFTSLQQEILAHLHGRLVLVAEDDLHEQFLIKETIRSFNFDLKVFCVKNGSELMDYLLNKNAYADAAKFPRPDLILSDLLMPVMDGHAVLKAIRDTKDETLTEIPIIMITHVTSKEEVNQLYMLGAKCCIDKGSSFEERLKILELMTETYLTQKREKELLKQAIQNSIEQQRRTRLIENAYEKFKNSQSKFFQSSKMATIGELGANIAHELNQPLTGILSISDYTRKLVGEGHPLYKDQSIIYEQALRMSAIIENLLDFAKPHDNLLSAVNVRAVIDSTLALCRATLRNKKINIRITVDADLPPALGNFNMLQQVLLNLLVNAKNALSIVDRAEKEISITAFARQNPHEPGKAGTIEIIVSDNGIAVTPEVEQKMFDPFFTTLADKKGTGLGLFISYGIMKDMDGDLRFQRGPQDEKQFVMEINADK